MKVQVLAALILGAALVAIFIQSGAAASIPILNNKTQSATQSPASKTVSASAPQVVPAVDLAEPSRTAAGAAGKLPACGVNVQYSTDLAWNFGSKQQRGWVIYIPLINHLIGTESGVGTDEFARSLSRWQSAKGLSASGILDQDTWETMVHLMQSERIKDRQYPPADRLVTVSSNEFWDQSRPAELRQVERDTYCAYTRMMAAAAAEPSLHLSTGAGEHYLKIISAFRPREYQDQLRQQSPAADRSALAVNSPHFTGRALDLYVGGDPVSTKDPNRMIQTSTPVYRWLVQNAGKFGFKPYFYEPWHWEYTGPAHY
ncbi:MAG TPA: M15 family metallopeptidase [Blastocatellia bacterium]